MPLAEHALPGPATVTFLQPINQQVNFFWISYFSFSLGFLLCVHPFIFFYAITISYFASWYPKFTTLFIDSYEIDSCDAEWHLRTCAPIQLFASWQCFGMYKQGSTPEYPAIRSCKFSQIEIPCFSLSLLMSIPLLFDEITLVSISLSYLLSHVTWTDAGCFLYCLIWI